MSSPQSKDCELSCSVTGMTRPWVETQSLALKAAAVSALPQGRTASTAASTGAPDYRPCLFSLCTTRLSPLSLFPLYHQIIALVSFPFVPPNHRPCLCFVPPDYRTCLFSFCTTRLSPFVSFNLCTYRLSPFVSFNLCTYRLSPFVSFTFVHTDYRPLSLLPLYIQIIALCLFFCTFYIQIITLGLFYLCTYRLSPFVSFTFVYTEYRPLSLLPLYLQIIVLCLFYLCTYRLSPFVSFTFVHTDYRPLSFFFLHYRLSPLVSFTFVHTDYRPLSLFSFYIQIITLGLFYLCTYRLSPLSLFRFYIVSFRTEYTITYP